MLRISTFRDYAFNIIFFSTFRDSSRPFGTKARVPPLSAQPCTLCCHTRGRRLVHQQTLVLLLPLEVIRYSVFSFPVFRNLSVRNMHLTLTLYSDVRDGAIGRSKSRTSGLYSVCHQTPPSDITSLP